MQRIERIAVLGLAAVVGLCGCEKKTGNAPAPVPPPAMRTTPPGYSGAVPSPAAQGVAKALRGGGFTDDRGVSWKIVSFAVVPNPVSGLGPVVEVERAGGRGWLPTPADGDIADLYRRAHGTAHPTLAADLSAEYQKALAALR